jgi:hypothetical protein
VDLMVGASMHLMECWIFSYCFFLSMHGRDRDRGWMATGCSGLVGFWERQGV